MFLRWILFVAIILSMSVTGCETVKGTTTGFGKDIQNTADNVPDVWAKLQQWDAWLQEHLW